LLRNEPEWIEYEVVLAIQEAQLAEHGGLLGIRDQGLLESALARPKNLFAYSPDATLKQLAAAYAVGIGKNHAFLDGNKRTAWFVCAVFLELNGISVDRDQLDVVRLMLEIANSSMTEEEVAAWLEQD
jgi:death-on-curing protein